MRWVLLYVFITLLSCKGPASHKQEGKPAFTNITACLFSQLTYCKDPEEQAAQYLSGWKIVWNAVAVNGNHALVARDGEKHVVAIRGSLMEFSWDAFENWIYQDFNIATQEDWGFCEKGSKARISTGSYRGWKNIIQIKDKSSGKDLLTYLLENTRENDPVYITGHSLGGNLATVFASYLSFKFREAGRSPDSINVITFAAPAAGNTEFARDFDKKFPRSIRIENAGDIVPKFPCTSSVADLGSLYSNMPAAGEISVGYKNLSVPLPTVFKMISAAMVVLEYRNGISSFKQTNDKGTIISVPLSGRNTTNDISSWFAEAGYQHGIAQYAKALGAAVIDCP
jgi:hypothetical protein